MKLRIREAVAADYDALCDLFQEVDALHRRNLPWLFREPNGPVRDRDYVLGLMDAEAVGLFVAQVGDELAGLVCIMLTDSPDIPIFVPRRYAVIDNLVVKEGSRRAGTGRALMARAHEWAMAQGAESIDLNVFEFNQPALDFYRALGYDTASRRMSKRLR